MSMFSRTEAAVYLGVSVSTMARWAHKREGPAYKRAGRKTRYLKCDLDAFLDREAFKPQGHSSTLSIICASVLPSTPLGG